MSSAADEGHIPLPAIARAASPPNRRSKKAAGSDRRPRCLDVDVPVYLPIGWRLYLSVTTFRFAKSLSGEFSSGGQIARNVHE